MTLRRMVEESVNTAAVRLAVDLGLEEVAAAARRAGISSPLRPLPSMALGSFEVTPLELTGAYATFASGGVRGGPLLLETVIAEGGEVLLNPEREEVRTVEPEAAFLVTWALRGVVDRGTASKARRLGVEGPVAGKTGTSDGYRDSWFAGYTPDLVCTVWVGRDSGGSTGLTGSSGALEIWARFMSAVGAGAEEREFTIPERIEFTKIDPETGYRATSNCPEKLEEAFLEGTSPGKSCPIHPGNPLVEGVKKGVRGIGSIIKKIFKYK